MYWLIVGLITGVLIIIILIMAWRVQGRVVMSVFFDRMTDADLKARASSSRWGYRMKYATSMRPLTDKQRKNLTNMLDEINNMIRPFAKLRDMPWKFIKVGDHIENGYPHTINDYIVINDKFFRNSRSDMMRILIHEQVHVFQRAFPEETRSYITNVLGFQRVDERNIKDKTLLAKRRNNPDVSGLYAYHGRFVPLQLYEDDRPVDIAHSQLRLYDLIHSKITNNTLEYDRAFPSSFVTQKEHPNEIMAVIIALVIFDGRRQHSLFEKTLEWLTSL